MLPALLSSRDLLLYSLGYLVTQPGPRPVVVELHVTRKIWTACPKHRFLGYGSGTHDLGLSHSAHCIPTALGMGLETDWRVSKSELTSSHETL